VIHGYRFVWLPDSLLRNDQQPRLIDALVATSGHWRALLQFNKNKDLAGTPAEEMHRGWNSGVELE
jgi:hypothetical protein